MSKLGYCHLNKFLLRICLHFATDYLQSWRTRWQHWRPGPVWV